MTVKRDYYDILGVAKSASHQEIEQAYRKLAIQHHPDRVPPEKKNEAREKFKEITEAYAVLSDSNKRSQYDQFGHAGIDGRYTQEDIFRGVDFSSIFENMGFGGGGSSHFEDIFEIFGGGRRSRQPRPQRGDDIEYSLQITLEEAYNGTEKTMQFYNTETCPACKGTGAKSGTGMKKCPACHGTGQQSAGFGGFFTFSQTCSKCYGRGEIIESPCGECRGRGKVKKGEKLTVKIPPGVDNGTGIVIRGRGEAGELGGPQGDLYVVTHVQSHPMFERHGDNLYIATKIPYPTMCLGGEATVSTIDGFVKLTIPPGTQPDKVFRLRDKGMPNIHSSRKGDLYVKVEVDVPTKLDGKQKTILQELKKTFEK